MPVLDLDEFTTAVEMAIIIIVSMFGMYILYSIYECLNSPSAFGKCLWSDILMVFFGSGSWCKDSMTVEGGKTFTNNAYY
jgi:hypothetical protein